MCHLNYIWTCILHMHTYTNTKILCVAKSCLTLCDPMDCSCQAPLSMGFSRQEYWSGLPFPPPGDRPNPGIGPTSPALSGGFFTAEPPGKPKILCTWLNIDIHIVKSNFLSIKLPSLTNDIGRWYFPHQQKRISCIPTDIIIPYSMVHMNKTTLQKHFLVMHFHVCMCSSPAITDCGSLICTHVDYLVVWGMKLLLSCDYISTLIEQLLTYLANGWIV